MEKKYTVTCVKWWQIPIPPD